VDLREIERGQRIVTVDDLMVLAVALKVTLVALLFTCLMTTRAPVP